MLRNGTEVHGCQEGLGPWLSLVRPWEENLGTTQPWFTRSPRRHCLLSTVLGPVASSPMSKSCCSVASLPPRGWLRAEKGPCPLGLHSEHVGLRQFKDHRWWAWRPGASTHRHGRFLFSLRILPDTRAGTAHPNQPELACIKTLHFKLLGGGGRMNYLLFSFMSPIDT